MAFVLNKGKEQLRVLWDATAGGVRIDPSKAPSAFVRNRDFVPVAFDASQREIRCLLDGLFTEAYVAGRFFGFTWHNEEPGKVENRPFRATN